MISGVDCVTAAAWGAIELGCRDGTAILIIARRTRRLPSFTLRNRVGSIRTRWRRLSVCSAC